MSLISIEKAGGAIRVHPNHLNEHQRLGWRVSVEQPEVAVERPASNADTDDGMTKAEIITALEARGVEVDGRTGIAKLKEMLEALPAD